MIALTPRDYQEDGLTDITQAFKESCNEVLYVSPTGSGKTVLFTYISLKANLKGSKGIILVHRIELLRQTSKALLKFEVEHGMVNSLYTPNFQTNIQVASVGTIVGRLNYFASINWIPDFIIIDECHHSNAKSYTKIIDFFKEQNSKLRIIGVTATPTRSDGQGLGIDYGGHFSKLIMGPQAKWLMEQGYLVYPKVYGTPEYLDLSGVDKSGSDYNKQQLSDLVDKPKITGSAVQHYEELCNGVPTIVFCVTVAHAEHVAQEFRDSGHKFYSIDGNTDDDKREWLINGLATGEVQGLTSCELISEGTDIPRATCAIELRPTQSKTLNMQQRGRVLRPVYADGYDLKTQAGRLAAIAASEKPYAIILDHVNNTQRHGLPTDIQEWTLEGERKKRSAKKQETAVRVTQCLSCFAVHEPAPVCPECGHIYPIRDTTPKQVEGKLQEITEVDILKKQKRQEVGRASTLEELVKISKERGYDPKWATIQYMLKAKKREKLMPPMPVIIDVVAEPEHEPVNQDMEHEFSNDLEF